MNSRLCVASTMAAGEEKSDAPAHLADAVARERKPAYLTVPSWGSRPTAASSKVVLP